MFNACVEFMARSLLCRCLLPSFCLIISGLVVCLPALSRRRRGTNPGRVPGALRRCPGCYARGEVMVSGGANIDWDGSVMATGQQSPDQVQLSQQWARVCGRLQSEVGDVEYRTWLRQMSLGGIDGDEITVRLPTRFLRDWVRTHYGDRLSALWQAENRRVRRVDIRVANRPEAPAAAPSTATSPTRRAATSTRGARRRAHRHARRHHRRARPALHLRLLRGRQAQRVRPRLCEAGRRAPGQHGLQPAVPLRRRRAWARPT